MPSESGRVMVLTALASGQDVVYIIFFLFLSNNFQDVFFISMEFL